jgi:hypothetical protein
MYSVLCDILSKDATSHMNARASQKKMAAEQCVYIFRAPLYIYNFQISFETTNFIIPFPENWNTMAI